jgi:hypothetical protein
VVDLDRRLGRRGRAWGGYEEHSRSARWAGALRVILPVAHGGGDALRLMIA